MAGATGTAARTCTAGPSGAHHSAYVCDVCLWPAWAEGVGIFLNREQSPLVYKRSTLGVSTSHRSEVCVKRPGVSPPHCVLVHRAGTAPMPEECVDCNESKRSAEARAAAAASGGGQLQLGECDALYREWTACIERTGNQASECQDVLKRFRTCHAKSLRARQ